jgi:hypothetical protein
MPEIPAAQEASQFHVGLDKSTRPYLKNKLK